MLFNYEGQTPDYWYFFIDKHVPFGASISCSHFQQFSNALKSIIKWIVGCIMRTLVSKYLDDFLFIYVTANGCNKIVCIYLNICNQICFPVSLEKIEWSLVRIVFLGILLDGEHHMLSIS